ncbi:type VI secretion system contractile sheath large subunit [Pseudomonas sp. UMAB-08]|uniref:type VI secretion system contractile sheath large subunit n=1 Tax=Pseudomonas sp. UMAB-08 TaxID=1365375 RepID=UPI001C569B8C|nr:type VI secretion system contractile sheath large subunit [Pseudomonas sp. UMAB-08]
MAPEQENTHRTSDSHLLPRTHIAYDVETGGALEKRELPFVVGILADLSGNGSLVKAPTLENRAFVDIDRDHFDALLGSLQPRITFTVQSALSGRIEPLNIELTFNTFSDFSPEKILGQVPELKDLSSDQVHAQLNLILHSKPLQALEASWRGLHQLVMNTETGPLLTLRLLDVTKEELRLDLESAVDFDQSLLFQRVSEPRDGTLCGSPFGILLGDYAFGQDMAEIQMLTGLSNVAAAVHAPFLTAASPAMFNLQGLGDLDWPRELSTIFESPECVDWLAFRDSENSRYVAMVVPRYLARPPYDAQNWPVQGMPTFTEDVHVSDVSLADDPKAAPYTDPEKFLWGNAAWLLAQRITEAFALYHWCAAIQGIEGGGAVSGLPVYAFNTRRGGLAESATEVRISDDREQELENLSFIALCYCESANAAVFFGSQTTNRPKRYFNVDTDACARLGSLLPYILATSRFAHYIEAIMRSKIGSFMTRANVESYLNNWIAGYVLLDDNATQKINAQYPLREAKIVVTDVPGQPGSYLATMFLRPHFQLEELTVSIRVVVELPK